MSLKFKGHKSVSDVLQTTKKGKAAFEEINRKRKANEISQESQLKSSFASAGTARIAQKNAQEPKKHQILEKGDEKLVVTTEVQKTPAQLAFELVQKKRQQKRIIEKLKTNYKQKIDNFNKGLNDLPEHFDIPKVGPG